jgi:hypothetical protein
MGLRKMKISLDVHGVLDNPEIGPVLAYFSGCLVRDGHEVHIVTGSEWSEELFAKLRRLGVRWTHFFSVTDHHKALGIEISRDSKGRPWMDAETWNPTKAMYCKKHGIDLHFDDSAVYHKFFQSPYCQVRESR